MPTTYVDYTATAAQTDFAFTFPYLEDEHVTVEIDGVVQLTSAYSIVTTPSTKVVLNVGATAGQVVRVRRKSQPDTNLVDFVNGSVLTESELDRAYLHNRYLAEEISELNDASLQKAAGTTNWDAGNNKIVNVATPTDTSDASTKDYVDAKVNQVSSGASSPPTKWVFTGTAGANTTYSVTGAEVNGDTAYDVSIDGAVKEPTTDYTVDPDTDTLTIVPTLSGGEDIVVIERGFGIAVTTGTIGSSQIQDGAVTTDKIQDGAVTSAKISTTDTKFNVQSDGKVGIGTASPSNSLDVVGFIKSDTGFLGISGRITLETDGVYISTNDTDAPIKLVTGTGSTEKMRITSDGNVGIGTESPYYDLDVVGDVNITGGYKVSGANLLLDEDAMTSNSDTQGATQQSIKAYVDAQVSSLSKYASSWFNNTTGLANGGTYTFTHGLGTKDINVTLWMATDASGSNQREVNLSLRWTGAVNSEGGGQILNVSTTQLTVQLAEQGWLYLDSNGDWQQGNWGTTHTHIKVIAIG